jgi:predicted PurR-regulated permease PerM
MENLDIIIGTLIGSGLTTLVAFFVARVSNRFKQINQDLHDVNQEQSTQLNEMYESTSKEIENLHRELDSQINKLESRLVKQFKDYNYNK